MSEAEFHPHVLEVKAVLKSHDDKERYEIIKKLTEPKDDVYLEDFVKMWRSLENYKAYGTYGKIWVFQFVESVLEASSNPPYYYESRMGQKELCLGITKNIKELTRKLQANDLDCQLVYVEDEGVYSKNQGAGFYFFEDMREKNQNSIIKQDLYKLPISEVLKYLNRITETRIDAANHKGKKTPRIEAIRFIRTLAERHKWAYDGPLLSVLKTASFAIYDVDYNDSTLSNLLNR